MKNLRFFFPLIFVAICISSAAPEIQYPQLKQRVNDFTNTLSFQEWQEVDKLLKSYEDTSAVQVVVLMVNSLNGENIEEYAGKTFELNKIGQEKNGNGILLLIVKPDQKVKVEAGGSLKNVLTDEIITQITRKEIFPYLKADNYFGGIVTGTDALVRAKIGEYKLDPGNNLSLYIIIAAAVILVIVITALIMKKKKGMPKPA